MKRIYVFFVCIMMVAMLVSCGYESPVLKVMLQSAKSDEAAYEYMAVYDNGKSSVIDAFDSDDAAFYTAESGDFASSIVNNTVINNLNSTLLIDDHGNKTNADEIMTAIMQSAADKINHDIIQFTIITDEDRYFAFVKLNVNWQSPCILYEYDAATSGLTELCRWDGVDLVGISIE